MALEVVGGAFLSTFLKEAFEEMASRDVMDFIKGKKHSDVLLEKLKITLMSLNPVLDDAEKKQISNRPVKQWLDDLKDVIFHFQDLLDEIKTEALRCKLQADLSRSSTSKENEFISALPHAFDNPRIEERLEELVDMLDFIAKQKDVLNLKEGTSHTRISQALPATSYFLDDSPVYGRNEDKETIINLLLSSDVAGNKIEVIPIVGMGGIGKTTLAQLVYNDARVQQHFEVAAWVCVSEEFDVRRITQTIHESVTSQTCAIRNLDMLQVSLLKALSGKKFLFVLDDIWNMNYVHWDFLRHPFKSSADGSKIIVTTRNQNVAFMMGTLQTHNLMNIHEEDCWVLFARHAFKNAATVGAHPNLEVIGRQIVRKCGGLPLAAKSLGCLLHSELNVKKWEKVLKSDIWELSDEGSGILPVLWLSYHYLAPHLKRCFAYCSIFPVGYEFKKSDLVLLWMAEDLLQPRRMITLEEVGEDYFDDLTSRSFFHCVSDNHQIFTMHDLVNDLAKFVSGEFSFRWEDNDSFNVASKTRHFSYMQKYNHDFEKFEALYKAKHLHTFLPLEMSHPSFAQFHILDKGLYDILANLQWLRVLKLSKYNVRKLPDSVSKLKHLRYLDLSHTPIHKLPEQMCNLYTLQTLLLSHCLELTQLPTNLGRLVNLRHLNIKDTNIQRMPPQMGKLKNLQTLSNFVLDKHSGYNIVELEMLSQLRGTLCISGLLNIVQSVDALNANMKDKKHLDELVLKWGGDTYDSQTDREVFENLHPHRNLKMLEIDSYGGTRFPGWLTDPSSNLVSLRLVDCRNCLFLPPLGQLPSLRELEIDGLNAVDLIGPEFYGYNIGGIKPFRSLQVLKITNMQELQAWSYVGVSNEGGAFPNLYKLCLRNCPKLTERFLLDYFPKLEWLELSRTNLESLAISQEPNSPKVLSLGHLHISACPYFVYFPDGGLPAPRLTEIRISGCKSLRSLPEHMHTLVPSLQSMSIRDCPELGSFPEEGLPPELDSLYIHSCKKLIENRMEWGLQRLTSLRRLSVGFKDCEGVDSFPEEGLLPTTLTALFIYDLLNLQTMNKKGFRHLNSLEELEIWACPELQCLPDERLPTSLSHLTIGKCPLLTQWCNREKGEDWPKIAHIPNIQIDENPI